LAALAGHFSSFFVTCCAWARPVVSWFVPFFAAFRTEGVSLGSSSSIFPPPSYLCHRVIVPYELLRQCGIGGVSPCVCPIGFRIVLMSGVNYRYTHSKGY
jgi:hypothetical protein